MNPTKKGFLWLSDHSTEQQHVPAGGPGSYTAWSRGLTVAIKKAGLQAPPIFVGQDGRIRTCDILVPSQKLYQTELHPDGAQPEIRTQINLFLRQARMPIPPAGPDFEFVGRMVTVYHRACGVW